MKIALLFICVVIILSACGPEKAPSPEPVEQSPAVMSELPEPTPPASLKEAGGNTIFTRFLVPQGFSRTEPENDSFESYIGNLTLKPDGANPSSFDGVSSGKECEAVVKWDVVKETMRNTSALIRLRAEYLYSQGRQLEVEYHFLSGFLFNYSKWAEGFRINVNGSKVEWVKTAQPEESAEQFQKYLNFLYAYTNVSAAEADLVLSESPRTGDVFTENGGAMIAGMATSEQQTAVILLKGSSPACEPYIMKNTAQPELSPWFIVSDEGIIYTDEGSFSISQAKQFIK